jgi:acyl-CoA synthetase (AMP-forming)/AMP-acid ligase II
METILDRLAHWRAETPLNPAFHWFDDNGDVVRSLNYSELVAECQKVAASVIQLGAKAGDRVLLCYPAGLDFIIAFLGCLMAHTIAGELRREGHGISMRLF